ncbi:fructose-1,6-bisphosphatase-3 [Clostridium acetobutylicum]|uniref:Fructose-1,6-bisphosphatase class 3 n=1 Tax=Clostridium acetobutylicum (strain ATCC 824 / DSM 792 / JCM 1419 / IAM 19013 / LMG 5710 / NBRC 13948 / NRRL B-527 / VKM B-1787 / 2291 / W) TaxID=272562 RepID=F16PC_CLOAB|nr:MULTISPECIES: fructose-1,6-bisphosphatase [Clostridium]Q97IR8.1 RecName: Full=Fructose-1,6-bisphosphatase class 3; Short=FBPase class 3; AltName: Full=D-fructose-1,6-bisphosphate 1-phosphohydrolase class 3 [Clostridium acetobutylicum ATCC 824]AAK79539.1 Fructose-1,6-bisphosphatase (YYDE B.subtils ortholog) [Clostridium acetobutylicum ATCC 824]ADZ20624.1 Fructose-1,6-bisphosphatase [Clostridium acetobutylicum EA 2018]AEI33349.1 fructose-1,6-bisphosphatase [Clostridium acetobutylicum DSM 1731]
MLLESNTKNEEIKDNLKYLVLLSKQYPTINEAATEIINLQAILNLPKGTEHFLSDVHGEYEQFIHVLKNASGVIKRKIDDIFGNRLMQSEKKSLATLIYYPEQKLDIILKQEKNIDDWYKITLYRLIEVCRNVSSKYTRSKVRKALPKEFSYIIEELLHEQPKGVDKQEYYDEIIKTIISIDRAKEFITAISKLIQRLVVDRLHIIGDIFDRGPRADIIMDKLEEYHAVDIQWGNHDILWMGAASGSSVCMANVIRISARYANLSTIEDGYGINLLPLATFAMDFYGNDKCKNFEPKIESDKSYTVKEIELIGKMHKAIAIIQFKLEGEAIKRHPEFKMEHRMLLNKINFEDSTIELDGKKYKLNDTSFPTIDKNDPYKLIDEEREVVEKLRSSFVNSEKLNRHVRFLFSHGNLYLKFNSNLLYHGCIPLNEDGTFKEVLIGSHKYKGKALLDKLDVLARKSFFYEENSKNSKYENDMIWYLWSGPFSPLFGKEKMTTFERYFIDDKKTHYEKKDPYYHYRDDEDICINILREFGLDSEQAHIINGHVPVESKNGENPIKANGKLIVIDGGFSKAYQSKTGIAGYTLIYNSFGLQLVSHELFETTEKAIKEETDIISSTVIFEKSVRRKRVGDTDIGKDLKKQLYELNLLLLAYKKGLIKEFVKS